MPTQNTERSQQTTEQGPSQRLSRLNSTRTQNILHIQNLHACGMGGCQSCCGPFGLPTCRSVVLLSSCAAMNENPGWNICIILTPDVTLKARDCGHVSGTAHRRQHTAPPSPPRKKELTHTSAGLSSWLSCVTGHRLVPYKQTVSGCLVDGEGRGRVARIPTCKHGGFRHLSGLQGFGFFKFPIVYIYQQVGESLCCRVAAVACCCCLDKVECGWCHQDEHLVAPAGQCSGSGSSTCSREAVSTAEVMLTCLHAGRPPYLLCSCATTPIMSKDCAGMRKRRRQSERSARKCAVRCSTTR